MQLFNLVKKNQRFGYHLVDPSPWPFVGATSVFLMAVSAAMYFHGHQNGNYFLLFGFFMLCNVFFMWWKDIVRESTYEGHHTSVVQQGLRYGVILFIISELFFFVAFFWAFFHNSVSPNIELGSIWPPKGITPFNPWKVPFLNTIILLLSACSITWAHHAVVYGMRRQSIYSFFITIFLAILFTVFQGLEYTEAAFCFSDGTYGCTFYMTTGFHGFHVIVGTIFLTICAIRLINYHLTKQHHFGMEAAIWYWRY
uniref:Cytochrome c oxidase subunit 3 n=1 Tax=Compsopogon caeruleus TaxID=31354 RepID=A0A1Z1XBF0_9RHOD|nr:cytochrome c oxidase subunit 3 [Compsopogon caeruleus]ARX96193.1 cytochrome c oxidase subunit 3 [Compsopogon caeruleus]